MNRKIVLFAIAVTLLGSAAVLAAQAPQQPMSFFVTSTVPGTGNLGGLAGADQICQNLAAAAGAGGKTWHAYLSQQAQGNTPAVNARGRIGPGPWYNAKGQLLSVYTFKDDQTATRVFYDPTNDAQWSTATNTYNAQGALTVQNGIYDDGTTWNNSYNGSGYASTNPLRVYPNDYYGSIAFSGPEGWGTDSADAVRECTTRS